MKVVQINIFGNLSTGRIAVDILRMLILNGNQGVVAFARNSVPNDIPYIKIGNKFSIYLDGLLTRLTDRAGFFSKNATRKLISKIKEYNPDIIHLHNLHGYYINIEILFNFLKQYGKPVIWTLHDCWAFTGHCCYYSMVKCIKWIDGCHNCSQFHAYPKSLIIDNSKKNYRDKKDLFTSLPNLHLVAVSKWLNDEVRKSFFKDFPCYTIFNGIDLSIFKPTDSDFRERYGLKNKVIILGVASTWDARKGLNDFIELSYMLSDKYKIVVVGINKREKEKIPKSMLAIERIDDEKDLAKIYSASDVFFNASVEETFGLTTIEAMACGTPVIVYNCTALPEVVDKSCGYVVREHDLSAVLEKIKNIDKFSKNDLIEKASKFSRENMIKSYMNAYMKCISET